jgi:Domain of unknown function (DUF5134)
MGGPSWLADILAAVMIATAAYCVTRLAAARRMRRPTEYDVDAAHVLMGVAMAGMLVPRLNPFWDSGWEVIFAAATAWFGWQIIRAYRAPAAGCHRPGHHLPHLLASGAMLYMFLAVSTASTVAATGTAATGAGVVMGGAGAAHFRTLGLVLMLALLGYVVWTTDKFTSLAPVAARGRARTAEPALAGGGGGGRAGPGASMSVAAQAGPAGRSPMSPRLAACCEIAMGLTMGYMLVLLL